MAGPSSCKYPCAFPCYFHYFKAFWSHSRCLRPTVESEYHRQSTVCTAGHSSAAPSHHIDGQSVLQGPVAMEQEEENKSTSITAQGESSSSTLQGQQTQFESITHYSTSAVDNMAPKACQAPCRAHRDVPAPERLPSNSYFTVIFQKHSEIKALLSSPRHSFSLVEHISIHQSEKQLSVSNAIQDTKGNTEMPKVVLKSC